MGFEMREGGDLRKRPRISERNEENIGFFYMEGFTLQQGLGL